MNRMRLRVVLLIFMLLLFLSIEGLLHRINACRAAYVFTALMAVVGIMVHRGSKMPLWALLAIPIPIFLLVKSLEGDTLWGAALPVTVTEVGVIAITTILASWVGNAMSEFEHAIAHITIGPVSVPLETSSTSQAELYREIRRARHHQRPLSIIALGIEEGSIQVVLDRLVKETQGRMMKRYVLADVARTLCSELEDYNLIAHSDDCFLILLPEMSSDEMGPVIDRLRTVVHDQVGITPKFGTASFPESATTFESLVDIAVGQIVAHGQSLQNQPSPLPMSSNHTPRPSSGDDKNQSNPEPQLANMGRREPQP
jgi:GGDEF domain-containing protein